MLDIKSPIDSTVNLFRRQFALNAGLTTMGLGLTACKESDNHHNPSDIQTPEALPQTNVQAITGGYTNELAQSGHIARDYYKNNHNNNNDSFNKANKPITTIKTKYFIAGAGVSGLSATRALRLKHQDDFIIVDLAESMGGNARSSHINEMIHPLGAHYLPVPHQDKQPSLINFLEAMNVCYYNKTSGRFIYDERYLCRSPQERLWHQGQWQEGLLPYEVDSATHLEYQQFSRLIAHLKATQTFHIPQPYFIKNNHLLYLKTITFEDYLKQHGFKSPALYWYLNYCCYDDYGAGLNTVSAWAGIHYFAARHGFNKETSGILTWAQGNAFLTQGLSNGLNDRLKTGRIVLSIDNTGRYAVKIKALNTDTQAIEHYEAEHVIVALPAFIASKVVINPSDRLLKQAQMIQYSAWRVANLLCETSLDIDVRISNSASEMAWDNVICNQLLNHNHYNSNQTPEPFYLGYVNANHQMSGLSPSSMILTHYTAYGISLSTRKILFNQSWDASKYDVLSNLAIAHPDILNKVKHINITRYGHAMAVPVPSSINTINTINQPLIMNRLRFAHTDWAGYSIFEEAFEQGIQAVQGI